MSINDDNLVSDYLSGVNIDDATLDEVIQALNDLKSELAGKAKYKELRFRIEGDPEDGYYVELRGIREMTDIERKYHEETTGKRERAELARLKAKYEGQK